MAQHTITVDLAGAIDAEWINAGSPSDGLRLVDYRISGNRTVTHLCCPGDEWAPAYERRGNGYVHIAGPEIRMSNKQYTAIYALADAGISLPI